MGSMKETVIKLFYHSNPNVLTLLLVMAFVTVFVKIVNSVLKMRTVWMLKCAKISIKMNSNVLQIAIDRWWVMENVKNSGITKHSILFKQWILNFKKRI